MSAVEVYLPVAVVIDSETGEMQAAPYIDFEGAPWMYVDKQENVWLMEDDDPRWIRDETVEEHAIAALMHLASKWGDK